MQCADVAPHLSTCAHAGTEEGGVGWEPEDVACSQDLAASVAAHSSPSERHLV